MTDERVVKRVRDWLGIRESKAGVTEAESDSNAQQVSSARNRSQATRLVDLAANAELFSAPDGDTFASVANGDHSETWSLKSSGFKNWLARHYYEAHGDAPSVSTLKDALGVL